MKTTYIVSSDEYKELSEKSKLEEEYNYRITNNPDDIGYQVLKVKLLHYGKMPKRGREGDAGFDIFLPWDTTIPANETVVINTGVCVEIAKGYAGMMIVRSSISQKGLIVQPPLIDSNYRGEIHIVVTNNTDRTFYFNANDRLCSLLVFPIYSGEAVRVNKLSESNRGESWSGSSGK